MKCLSKLLSVFFLFVCFGPATAAEESGRRPNNIIILADDLAWADVGCYGAIFHETPSLDRLAAEGMRFTNGYAVHMSCSPSRAALLTGRYPARLKITAFIPGPTLSGKYLPGEMRMQLPFEEVTLAEVLKEAGYATLFVGKWHLGDSPFTMCTRRFRRKPRLLPSIKRRLKRWDCRRKRMRFLNRTEL